MIITDGHGYKKELKTYEQFHAELLLHYLKTRRVNPLNMQVKTQYRLQFVKDLRKKVDKYFINAKCLHSTFLRNLNIEDNDELWERTRAFEAEAARIKDSEYSAKIASLSST